MNSKTIDIHKILHIEEADSPLKRSLGLMYRKSLDQDSGMLFIFPDSNMRSFWMKDTHIPLSIAYIDRKGIIINIEDMKPLEVASVKSSGPCKYALEVNQGWFEKNGISVGDKIKL